MALLQIDGIGVALGGRAVLQDIDVSIDAGEVVSLLGPSGSGKTTLLRVIAGLELPARGRVLLNGRDLADVPAHLRGVGLMFQDFGLFPHMDVERNVAFGLRMQGLDRRATEERVAEMLALVGLPGIGRRSVSTLSGGEQQRVALARALAPQPAVLMLDEPMGSLDRELRERLPQELRAIFDSLDVTVIYVTHDQEEALAVADRTIVLRAGRIEADGPAEALWTRPPTPFVARFLGHRNVASAEVRGDLVITPWGVLNGVPGTSETAGGRVTVLLRSDALRLDAGGSIHGTVSARRFRGDHFIVEVAVDSDSTRSEVQPLEVEARGASIPRIGDAVSVAVDLAGAVLLAAEAASDTSG
jgi:thiamine transport system ATP-binding protein